MAEYENSYENAIEISNMTKSYGEFKLDNVSLTLPKGYVMGLIGENGAGKTTLIKTMQGVVKFDDGEISILGSSDISNDRALKEKIGVVMDECDFPEEMTAVDINRMMARIYRTWNKNKFMEYMKRFGIPENKRIKELSKGMKMKLSVGAALSHASELLILDEATGGLDPVARDEILDIFRDFVQDESHSVLISSHILSDLEKICDYITFIHKGRIVFSQVKDELLEKYVIAKCTEGEFASIDGNAVVGYRKNHFGIEALVDKGKVGSDIAIDEATIEDIMLYFIREGENEK